ncbi:MAG: S8 family peptidase [Lachnospiraceae bacterium]|nr:S8 family peptidase [Lachnospiraceae bacterium]
MTINIINSVNEEQNCLESINSEQFFNYVVQYNGNLNMISQTFGDDVCVNIINGQYAIAYRRLSGEPSDMEDILKPGYEFVPKCYGLMDVDADEKSGVTALKNLPGLSLSGNNTLVGFVDTGIDYTLNMFRKTDGSSRIRYIWDQGSDVESNMSEEIGHFGFGALYTREDINQALREENPYSIVGERDDNGHGTFMASVAAGGNVGIADGAEIVVVKVRQVKDNLRQFYAVPQEEFCCGEDDVMLGVRFLIEVAQVLGRPLTICLGIGTNLGAHEGRSLLERYLTFITSFRNICVVTPVGNELGAGTHYRGGTMIPFQPVEEDVEISVDEDVGGFSMEIWAKAPVYLNVSIISPTGQLFGGISPFRDGFVTGRFLYEGTEVDVLNIAIDTTVGTQMLFIRFRNVVEGIWKLRISETAGARGEGYDSWLPIRQFTNGKVSFVSPDSETTICAPGSANGPITVTAYNVENDTLYSQSSRGFNRRGFIKPELAASGVAVIGAFAGSGYSPGREDLLISRSGSSVSAAIVAGMVCMILEWAVVKGNVPNIENEMIKRFLVSGTIKQDTLSYPNPSWGWGAVNLLESFSLIRI